MGGISFAPIPGTDGRYVADSKGNIYGPRKRLTPHTRRGGPRTRGREHLAVRLSWGRSRQETRDVHRLVYEAFHGPLVPGQLVRHLNGVATDNRLSNLAAGSFQDNADDAVRHGTSTRGEAHPASKLTWAAARQIRQAYAAGGVTGQSLADTYGVTTSIVFGILNNKRWVEREAS